MPDLRAALQRIPPAAALLAMALLYALTRLWDLGRQSPWNDEVFNWQYAEELGSGGLPEHRLTYALIHLALRLGEGIFFVRLPMALAMGVAGLLLAGWAWRRLGRGAGLAVGALFLFNPMAIVYGQDGGHYGLLFLGGTMAMVSAGEAWLAAAAGSTRRWLLWGLGGNLAAAVFLLAHLAHAVAVAGSLASVLAAAWLLLPQWSARLSLPRGRLVAGYLTAAALCVAGGLALAIWRIRFFPSMPLTGAGYFSWHPAILLRIPANLLGAYMRDGLADVLLGVLALVLIGAHFRRPGQLPEAARGAVLAAALTAALFLFLFGFFRFTAGFHLRYWIGILPGVLLAVALALVGAGLRWQKGLAAAVVLLFLVRTAPWMAAYYGGHFQPLLPALDAVRTAQGPGAIVATRIQFLYHAMAELERRRPAPERLDVRFLGERAPSSRNAVQQALYLAATESRPINLLDMEWQEEEIHVDYHQFTRGYCQPVARLASWCDRDYVGYGRSIIWRTVPASAPFGALPQGGASAIRAFPVDAVSYYPPRKLDAPGTPNLAMRSGGSATWWIREIPASGLTLELESFGVKEDDWWAVVIAEPGPLVSVQRLPRGNGISRLVVAREDLPTSGAATVHLTIPVVKGADRPDSLEAVFRPIVWRATAGTEESRATPVKIARESGGPIRSLLPAAGANQQVETVMPADGVWRGPVLHLYPFETTGVAATNVRALAIGKINGEFFRVEGLRGSNSGNSVGWHWAATILDSGTELSEGRAILQLSTVWTQMPRGGALRWRPIETHALEE